MNNLEKLGFDNWFWESSARSPSDIPLGKDKVASSSKGLGGLHRQSQQRNGVVVRFLEKSVEYK